jgi:acyl-coenzyme A synthetase/AMP-(fatty) acid ligase/3-hydroxymyristoyl/3-hydroxydecanoyl-(acyl carrier protein) dehydratase
VLNAIPLLGHNSAHATVAIRAGRAIPAAEFLADASALARRMPGVSWVVNACKDRYAFAVAFAAALARGKTSLLPPNLVPETLAQLAGEYPGYFVVTDSYFEAPGVQCLHFVAGAAVGDAEISAFSIAPDHPAVIAFTSGTTGKPAASRKTWGALARGARAEAARLGLANGGPHVLLGTVPPQHMYGLESTVLLPLVNGLAFHAAHPFYPADVRAALEEMPEPRVLITTPVHLRALLQEQIALPSLRLAICATAPLAIEAAAQFEARYAVQLHEIYGFTEAGMVATRRTACESEWQALPDLTLGQRDGRAWVRGGHVVEEVALPDLVELHGERSFLLLGRGEDVVNIGGKRSSLAFLNHQLNSVDGVRDGTFFLPDEDGERVVRPMAFVVAPGLTRDAVLSALRSRIDPVFLPRPLVFVEALPRAASGKLPRQALTELAARSPRRAETVLERVMREDHPANAGHFPGNPVVPGAVLLEEIVATVRQEYGWKPGPLRMLFSKFTRPVRPGERLLLRLSREDEKVRFEATVQGQQAVSGVLEPGVQR